MQSLISETGVTWKGSGRWDQLSIYSGNELARSLCIAKLVSEGHERLVGGHCCSDLAPVLVTGTWDCSSQRPAGLTQAEPRTTERRGTPGLSSSSSTSPAGRRRLRPCAAKHIGFQAFGRSFK
ncbi:hypothetical protein GJAV_G00211040 [Gymnothorax javanicus]|nr:hypothetical protein GJAV_G00211040 [Gymnothorax javanicus]